MLYLQETHTCSTILGILYIHVVLALALAAGVSSEDLTDAAGLLSLDDTDPTGEA